MKLIPKISKRKFIWSIVALLAVITLSFAFWVKSSNAQALFFGGKILRAQYCSCSGNITITVGPPVPGVFSYQPGASILYPFYQIFRRGPWVLGNYVPGGVCLMVGTPCYPGNFPIGTITNVATSL